MPGGDAQPVRVREDNDVDLAVSDEPVKEQFTPFGAGYADGLYVAAGPVENAGGGGADVAISRSVTGRTVIRTDSDADGLIGDNTFDTIARPYNQGTARLALGDTDHSGTFTELITGPSDGPRPVQVFYDDNADTGALISDNPLDDSFDAFTGNSGVHVGFARVVPPVAYDYPGQPQFIDGLSTVNSTLNVPASGGIIRDLDVTLNVAHTFVGDLDVTLTHVPTLWAGACGSRTRPTGARSPPVRHDRARMRRTAIPLLVALFAVACPAIAAAAPEPGTLTEKKVRSVAPGHRQVRESLVRRLRPAPAGGRRPSAGVRLDRVPALPQCRRARGGERADAVMVIIPGFLGGAGSFDQVARNTVRRAAQRGRAIEYWSLDRRANCLEDDTGTRAAARAGDATIAWDYYWGGKPVNGRTFAGFVSPQDAAFLGEFGLQRTMEDWYEVLRTGIPGQPRRARKVICGGHSLGGPLTAAFASWDFDGDPGTRRDAGYKQCAGLVGLDTTLALGGGSGGGPPLGGLGGAAGAAAPYVNVPPLTPETIQVPNVFGVGAYFDPQGTRPHRRAPAHHQHRLLAANAVLARRGAFREQRPGHPRLHPHQRGLAGGDLRRQLGAALVPALERRTDRRRAAGRQELPDPGRRLPGASRGLRHAAVLLGALPAGRRPRPPRAGQRRRCALHLP